MKTIGRAAVCCLVVSLVCAGDAFAAKWTRVRSPNFTFVGDVPDADLRRIARRLEQFRAVMAEVLPTAVTTSPAPTVVVVFSTDRAFTPFKIEFRGEAVDNLGGYFAASEDGNYIAINAEAGAAALETVFHEYAHYIIGYTAGAVPTWVNEGLASFYQMYEERDGGKTAMIGAPSIPLLRVLRERSTLMSLPELMAVDASSVTYNQGDRRDLFYAESWALMHYLILGNQTRAPQFRDYLRMVRAGTPSNDAFTSAFSMTTDGLEKELRDYIRRLTFAVLRIEFPERIVAARIDRGETLGEPDAQAYLGGLLARVKPDDGRPYLRKLIDATPSNALAVYALGMLELRQDHLSDALPLLERAAGMSPGDAQMHAGLGRALVQSLNDQRDDHDRYDATLKKARTEVGRAVELEPGMATTQALMGFIERSSGADLPRAIKFFEEAVRLAPTREEYRLMLAETLAADRQFEQASGYLGPLMARSADQEIRASARSLLARMAEERNRLSRPAVAAADAVADVPPRAVSATPPPPRGGAARRRNAIVLDLRRPAAGEQRVSGTFRSIECRPAGIVFSIARDVGTFRLAAKAFTDVEFITYRNDTSGSVTCGPLAKPVRVLVTYRLPADGASAGVDGTAVAIELIPDDYELDLN